MSDLASVTFALMIPYDVDMTVDSGCQGSDVVFDDSVLKLEVTELAGNALQISTGEQTFYIDSNNRLWKNVGYSDGGLAYFSSVSSFGDLAIDAGEYFSAYPTANLVQCWKDSPKSLDGRQRELALRVFDAIEHAFPQDYQHHWDSHFWLGSFFGDVVEEWGD